MSGKTVEETKYLAAYENYVNSIAILNKFIDKLPMPTYAECDECGSTLEAMSFPYIEYTTLVKYDWSESVTLNDSNISTESLSDSCRVIFCPECEIYFNGDHISY